MQGDTSAEAYSAAKDAISTYENYMKNDNMYKGDLLKKLVHESDRTVGKLKSENPQTDEGKRTIESGIEDAKGKKEYAEERIKLIEESYKKFEDYVKRAGKDAGKNILNAYVKDMKDDLTENIKITGDKSVDPSYVDTALNLIINNENNPLHDTYKRLVEGDLDDAEEYGRAFDKIRSKIEQTIASFLISPGEKIEHGLAKLEKAKMSGYDYFKILQQQQNKHAQQ